VSNSLKLDPHCRRQTCSRRSESSFGNTCIWLFGTKRAISVIAELLVYVVGSALQTSCRLLTFVPSTMPVCHRHRTQHCCRPSVLSVYELLVGEKGAKYLLPQLRLCSISLSLSFASSPLSVVSSCFAVHCRRS